MNLKQLHPQAKGLSTASIFKTEHANAIAIQILKNEQLKEHITKTPALLLCVEGEVVFENEKGIKEKLVSGDYINIEPMVKHWVDGILDSQLVLIK